MFVLASAGRDKLLRTLQYFARFYAWYLLRTDALPSSVAPFDALKKQFGLARKVMRLGKNVEHFKAAATAADAKNLDPVLRYCAVGRQLGYAMYLSLDMLTYVRHSFLVPRGDRGWSSGHPLVLTCLSCPPGQVDAAGIRPSASAKRLQREAYKAWLVGLLFSTVSGAYKLFQLQQRQQSINKQEGEGVVESKRLER